MLCEAFGAKTSGPMPIWWYAYPLNFFSGRTIALTQLIFANFERRQERGRTSGAPGGTRDTYP